MSMRSTSRDLMIAHDEIELPTTVEGLLTILRRILAKPFIQSITMQVGQPIRVVWHKDMSDSLDMDEPEDSAEFVLSRVELEEFIASPDARASLLDAILMLNQQRLHATHLFVGSLQSLRDWLGIPRVIQLQRLEGTEYLHFLGLKLLEVPSLPDDTVVLLASEVRDANRTELTKGIRITA